MASRTSRSPASTSASLSLPRPVSFFSAWSRRSVSESNTLAALEAELVLVVVKVCRRAAHHVVDGRSADPFSERDLAVGPVEFPGQMQNSTRSEDHTSELQ